MTKSATALLIILGTSACAYHASATREPGAPVLPPSPYAEILKAEPPADATLLGTVKAQGNNWQSASSCEGQLINEARKLGANAVLTTPASSSKGRGPSCTGKAYLVKK